MKRIHFEVLSTLSDGDWQTFDNQFYFASSFIRYNKSDYKKAVKDLLSYGLIERKDYSCPFDFRDSEIRITLKGYKALNVYEPMYYFGTIGAHDYMNQDFIGK